MSRFIAWVLVAFVLGTAAFGQTAPTTGEDEVALIKRGIAAFNDKKPAEAASLLKIAADSPAFSLVSEEGQYVTQRVLAAAAYDGEDYQTSERAARAATTFEKADADDWSMRVWASAAVDDRFDEVTSMTTLAAKWPDRMKEFKLRMIGNAASLAKRRPGGQEAVAHLMRALLAAKWKPNDALASDADWMWVQLIRFDLNVKQIDEARRVAARIESPQALREMQIDKVFDEIVATDPAHFDSDAAAERIVQPIRKWADDHADQLDAIVSVAIALRQVDRPADALALIDDAQVRIKHRGKAAFKDLDDELNWLHDTRSRVLFALGRNDQGLAELEAGAKLKEDGSENVSQILNLSIAYNDAGRPADALALLTPFNPKHVSGYGRMVYEASRVCAYAQLQDMKGLKDAMTFIDAYSGESTGSKLDALMCANDIDGAARYVIEQLQSPERRSAAIDALQDYALPKQAVVPAFTQTVRQRWELLRRREDVLKALEPYGRILHFKTIAPS